MNKLLSTIILGLALVGCGDNSSNEPVIIEWPYQAVQVMCDGAIGCCYYDTNNYGENCVVYVTDRNDVEAYDAWKLTYNELLEHENLHCLLWDYHEEEETNIYNPN